MAQLELGAGARIELVRELLWGLDCLECGTFRVLLRPLSAVTERDGECPDCGARRAPRLFHALGESSPFLDRTLSELGVPEGDVLLGRAGERRAAWQLAGGPAAMGRPKPAPRDSQLAVTNG